MVRVVLRTVRTRLSDPHNGGRTVSLVATDDGQPLIHKPRPVAGERAFAAVAARVATMVPCDLAPRAPAVEAGDGEGWCEYIQPRPIPAGDSYFRRLGALAALCAILRATDCHHANVVCDGERPVLVDAETLLHPRTGATPTDPIAATEIVSSEVVTGAGQTVTYSGHHGVADRHGAVDEGVAAMREALADREEELVALACLHAPLTRLILRPTDMYWKLLTRARATTRERLLRRFQDSTLEDDAWEAIRTTELRALSRGDIPYFLLDQRTGDVLDGDGSMLVPHCFG